MKSNEQQSPVDEYFRQHEAEIPVTYDPEHWAQLAAVLDSADPEQVPETPGRRIVPRRPRFGGGKGWWASGLWILVLTSTIWVIWQTAGGNLAACNGILPENSETPSVSQPAGPGGHSGTDVGTSGTNPSKPAASGKSDTPFYAEPLPGPGETGPAPGVAYPDSAATFSGQAADSSRILPLPALPLDSIPAGTKPVKKKKFLFW